jgi:hypothetical protein
VSERVVFRVIWRGVQIWKTPEFRFDTGVRNWQKLIESKVLAVVLRATGREPDSLTLVPEIVEKKGAASSRA